MSITVISGGNVLDLSQGALLEHHHVVIENGHIVEVTDRPVDLPNARVIDARGKTVMPGLIDCHVHVLASRANLGRQCDAAEYSHCDPRAADPEGDARPRLHDGARCGRRGLGFDAGARKRTDSGAAHFPVGQGAVANRRPWRFPSARRYARTVLVRVSCRARLHGWSTASMRCGSPCAKRSRRARRRSRSWLPAASLRRPIRSATRSTPRTKSARSSPKRRRPIRT